MRIEREIEVVTPPESTFAAIADWPSQAEWQPTLASVEAPEGVGLGRPMVEHRDGFGQHLTFDVEVIDWAPPHRVRVSARSRSRIHLAADEEFAVEPHDGGSLVRMALEFDLPLVLKPLAHGVGLEVGKQLDESLAALRDRLEGADQASRRSAAS
jgi:polyketide cyclase/dehydrase/lipid transport protein